MFLKRLFQPKQHPKLLPIVRRHSSEAPQKAHQAKIMSRGLPKQQPIPGVKNIILVSSGKGGVGKSTISVNLAAALKTIEPSNAVGLLDSDVFGPSIPLFMNLNESPELDSQNLMLPLVNYGIKCMSMGFLVAEGAPIIWRGLMVMQAIEKLTRQVNWGALDYLIVDTPPGTGDTHLSLVQNLPITGVLLVTTPQKASLDVTKRGAVMYQKLGVPIVGLVENMSSVKCDKCSSEIKVFGDGTKGLASEINVNILANFRLEQKVSESCEIGLPIVIKEPQSDVAKAYLSVAKVVRDFVALNESKNAEKLK